MAFLNSNRNRKLEVFKNGNQLFETIYTEVGLYPNLIVFVHDADSECAVLSPSTDITLEDGSTRIQITITDRTTKCFNTYEIEAVRPATAALIFSDILIAAGQKERPMQATTTADSSIQQLSNVLAHCLESMTNTFLQTYSNMVQQFPVDSARNGDGGQGYAEDQDQTPDDFGTGGPGIEEHNFPNVAATNHPPNSYVADNREFRNRDNRRSSAETETQAKRSHHDDTRQLFVGNLPQTITEDEITDIFSVFGSIAKIKIMPNNSPGVPYFAFVIYEDITSAHTALKCKANINMKMRNGTSRRLNIQATRPREGSGSESSGFKRPRRD